MTLIGHDVGTRILASGVRTATPGTAISLSATSQRCKRVIVQADEGNNDAILCVGDANIDADSDPPRGRMLYATQAEAFYVQDVTELHIDATGAAKAHFIAEG